MKLNIKILLIQIIVSIFSFEIFSFILLSTGLVTNIYHKSGFKKPKDILHQGVSWRTEEKSWGAWHKKNSISKRARKLKFSKITLLYAKFILILSMKILDQL